MPTLLEELLVSCGMAALLILAHMVGLLTLVRVVRAHIEHFRSPWLTLDRLLVPLTMGGGLFLIHGLEVWSYAAVYRAVGAARSWEEALYISAGAYSTAGWMDAHVPGAWRLMASLESLSGLLLVGWSTAFLFQTLHRILATEEGHPLPEGAIAVEVQEEVEEGALDELGPASSGV
jgi:hypothetical protein